MKPQGAQRLTVVPVTLPTANRVVAAWHRHHAPIPAGFVWFCVAAIADGELCGVAIAGRPTNRNNDDGQTVEVLRIASDGTPNACSAMLGACGKAGRAIGASRVITYTLDSESGSSLRGSGWELESEGITSSWMKGTSRRTAVYREHMEQTKARWALNIRPLVEFNISSDVVDSESQPSLFDGLAAEVSVGETSDFQSEGAGSYPCLPLQYGWGDRLMAHPAARKGARSELEAARILSDLTGWDVRRKLGAGRADDTGDLDGIPDTTIQVKNWRDVTAAVREARDSADQQARNAGNALRFGMVRHPGGLWTCVLSPSAMAVYIAESWNGDT